MNKKGQIFDIKIISFMLGILILIIIVPPFLQLIFSGFKSPNIEDIILPLIILAIFFQLVRRFIR